MIKHLLVDTFKTKVLCGAATTYNAELEIEVAKVTCRACLRAHRDALLKSAAAVSRRLYDGAAVRYGTRYQAPRHPCSCRTHGECTHDFGPTSREDKLALNRLVAAFADELRTKLHRKVDEGEGDWDGDNWTPDDIVAALLEHVGKGDPIDVAAFAAFWWNRWAERMVPCAIGEGCDCNGWHRATDEKPVADRNQRR